MAATNSQLIDDQYKKRAEAQTAKLTAERDAGKAQYENQLDKSDEAYQPLRNEAYVNHALAEKARKENMANMGMSGEGGTSLSLQQQNTGNLLNTLGDVSRQQQGYEDEINLALANLDTAYRGNVNSAAAETEAQRIAAQLSQSRFEVSNALSQNQYEMSKSGSLFSQYYQLLKAKRITKKQFEQATGIDLK